MKDKAPVRQIHELVVRYVPGIDDKDIFLMVFNLFALKDYCNRSPGAKDHAKKFPQFYSHKVRHVFGQGLGVGGAQALATGLEVKAFPRLTRLVLPGNDIRFIGCRAIARAISEGACQALTDLVLTNNNLGDSSAEELRVRLWEGEKSAPALRRIDLSCNQISCQGAASLARLLLSPTASPIAVLRLSDNRVGDGGAAALAGAANGAGSQLEQVVIRGNFVSCSMARKLGRRGGRVHL